MKINPANQTFNRQEISKCHAPTIWELDRFCSFPNALKLLLRHEIVIFECLNLNITPKINLDPN